MSAVSRVMSPSVNRPCCPGPRLSQLEKTPVSKVKGVELRGLGNNNTINPKITSSKVKENSTNKENVGEVRTVKTIVKDRSLWKLETENKDLERKLVTRELDNGRLVTKWQQEYIDLQSKLKSLQDDVAIKDEKLKYLDVGHYTHYIYISLL